MKIFQDLVKRFFKSKLFVGSFIMTLGAGLGGGLNYVYHLLMGRMLGPSDYGVLVSLISLSYILSIPIGTLGLVIVKFVSTLKGKEEIGSVRTLFKNINKKFLPISLLILLIFIFLTPLVSSFLHLPSSLLFIVMLVIFFVSIFSTISRSILQGLLYFGSLTISDILGVLVKVGVAVAFVAWGFKIYGALFGFLLGGIVTYLLTIFFLRFIFRKKPQKLKFKSREMFNFALPVFFSTLAFTSLYTSDVILVRHFFSGEQSGFYGALSTLGKIIFFVIGPVIAVSFPIISERHANGGKYRNILLASLGLVGTVCLSLTGIYFLFPRLIVKLLFGETYLPIASLLGYFGIFLSLYSLSFLLINFCLSIKKTKVVVLPVIAAVLQIILIWFFHQDFQQIIWISIAVTALLLVSLLGFLIKYRPKS